MQTDSSNEQRKKPLRCFVDYENGLVYELPDIQHKSWARKPADSAAGTTIFGIQDESGLLQMSVVITAEGVGSRADERALFEREEAVNQLVPGRPRLNSIREQEMGGVEVLVVDLSINEQYRAVSYKLYFRDKTVSVDFFCYSEEVFKQNEKLIESMGKSIQLLDPKREWRERKSDRIATTFRDEWLGIEIRELFPFTPSGKSYVSSLTSFSRIDDLECSLLVKQEFSDQHRDLIKESMDRVNPNDLLVEKQACEEDGLTWCMRSAVQGDEMTRFVGRVCWGGFVDRVSYGFSSVSLSPTELERYDDVGLLWERLGGSFPLSKYLPPAEPLK